MVDRWKLLTTHLADIREEKNGGMREEYMRAKLERKVYYAEVIEINAHFLLIFFFFFFLLFLLYVFSFFNYIGNGNNING